MGGLLRFLPMTQKPPSGAQVPMCSHRLDTFAQSPLKHIHMGIISPDHHLPLLHPLVLGRIMVPRRSRSASLKPVAGSLPSERAVAGVAGDLEMERWPRPSR